MLLYVCFVCLRLGFIILNHERRRRKRLSKSQRLLLRLVPNHLLDPLENLRRQLLGHLEGAHILVDLLRPRRPRDERRDIGVLERPGQRELGQRRIQLLSDGLELGHDGQVLLPRLVAERLGEVGDELVLALALGQTAARRRRGLVVVFARQDTLLQRREHRQPQPVLLVQPAVFALDALARQQVVLRLLDHGADQAQLVRHAPCFGDLAG